MCEEIKPVYDFKHDTSITLAKDLPATLCFHTTTINGVCDVELEYFPDTGVFIKVTVENLDPQLQFALFLGEDDLKLSVDSVNIDGFVQSTDSLDENRFHLRWCPSSSSVVFPQQKNAQLYYGVFHLFNLKQLISEKTLKRDSDGCVQFAALTELENDDWNIHLLSSKPERAREPERGIKQHSFFKFTHMGKLTHKHGHFSPEQFTEELTCLKYALSFALGSWTETVCPVGFDESDTSVWRAWSSPYNKKGKGYYWLDHEKTSDLEKFYPAFSSLWKISEWQTTLREVIYWYLESNSSQVNIDAGIILTQTAIERLSYHYIVIEKKLLSKKGFKDLWMSDKFRLLFASLRIPSEIPDEVPNLKQRFSTLGSGKNDAPFALTEIRNSLVHPDKNESFKGTDFYFETWKLGQWYLELALLSVMGYDGNYINRLKKYKETGIIVPWSKV